MDDGFEFDGSTGAGLTEASLAGLSESDAREVFERLPAVYRELRGVAASCLRSYPGHGTCAPTELVHEAWLKLCGGSGHKEWTSDGHFVAAAAIAMRQISIDRIRARQRQKRGGGRRPVSLDSCDLPAENPAGDANDDLEVAVAELLRVLAETKPRCARIVEMRFYLGLTELQCADALDLCERTVRRDWVFARAWLSRELEARGVVGLAVDP